MLERIEQLKSEKAFAGLFSENPVPQGNSDNPFMKGPSNNLTKRSEIWKRNPAEAERLREVAKAIQRNRQRAD